MISGIFNLLGVFLILNGEDLILIKKIKYVSKSKNLEEDIIFCDD